MKKIVLFSLLIAGISVAASAQTDRVVKQDSSKMRMHQQMGNMRQNQEMMKDLNLTPDQSAKMKNVMEEMRPKMDALRDNTSLTPDEKRSQLKALRDEQKTKVDAILTPDQRTKMEEKRKKMMEEKKRPDMGNVDPKSSDNPNKHEPN